MQLISWNEMLEDLCPDCIFMLNRFNYSITEVLQLNLNYLSSIISFPDKFIELTKMELTYNSKEYKYFAP